MGKRAQKGQAIILILIVLAALFVVFVLLAVQSTRVAASPTVQEAFWRVDGQTVTTARVGDEVEAHVVVKAPQEYVGSIVMKIRKDTAFWFDSDYSTKTVPVNIKGDGTVEIELSFVPDQASAGRFRGYFIEIAFQATHTGWVMESAYPPRLQVQA